jgi:transposase
MDQLEFEDFPPAPAAQPAPTAASLPRSPRFKAIDRQQNVLRAFALDTLIVEDHAARAIWEFLEQLDLAPFEANIKAVEGHCGQATIQPRLLIALWLYACSQGIGAAREVSRQCESDPGLRWLCGDQPVNYHTLSDFRVQHQDALRDLFTDALGVLSYHGLISLKQVAHDGTRIQTVAGQSSFHREATLEKHRAEAAAQVAALEAEEARGDSVGRIAARRRAAAERQQRLQQALEQMPLHRQSKDTPQEKAEARVSESEPEARVMKLAEGGFAPAYNAQVTSDGGEGGLILNLQMTQSGSDFQQLQPALEEVRENFGKMPSQTLVDGGYLSRTDIEALEGRTDLIGPFDQDGARATAHCRRRGIAEEYAPKFFVFHPDGNRLQCPAGCFLEHHQKNQTKDRIEHVYRARPSDCAGCARKPQCCPQSPSRSVARVEESAAVQRFRQKMAQSEMQALYQQRSRIAEFPFCWIKEKFGLRRFHVRGLAKAFLEMLWHALAYNILQWKRLRWRVEPEAILAN